MALVGLLVLSALVIALAALSGTDPVVAGNHYRAAVARAMAESGLEWVLWALGTGHGGLDAAALAPGQVAAAPHDGTSFTALGDGGGFTVKVSGVSPTEVQVDAVGWTPGLLDRAAVHRRVRARVMRLPDLGRETACAVCVRGDLEVRDSAVVSAAADTSCGAKAGAAATGSTTVAGEARVYGADGNDWPNQAADLMAGVAGARLDRLALDDAALAVLRSLARTNGTYYGPGSPPPGETTWTGRMVFDAGNPVARDGIVFVDTVSGRPPAALDPGDHAAVEFRGDPFPTGRFRGWIVVMGRVTSFDAVGSLHGLLYAADTVALTGRADVQGLIAAGLGPGAAPAATVIGGLATVTFDCAAARGAGRLPRGWLVKPGSYREVSD